MIKFIKNNFLLGSIILVYCLFVLLLQVIINPNPRAETHEAIAENHYLVHWSYGGSRNPSRWGKISAEYVLCKTGQYQSPINFDSDNFERKINSESTPKPLKFNYQRIPLTVKNNGHTIQVDYSGGSSGGSSMEIDGETYRLLQFHFHTPSEHTVDEMAYGMELHLVHQNQAGNFAVVGVFIEEGAENYFLQQIWDHLPESEGEKTLEKLMVNAYNFLPENREYYSYDGSLTTPPCSEAVKWYVMTTPIEASAEQIEQFMEIYPMNARPVQPLHRRKIHHH